MAGILRQYFRRNYIPVAVSFSPSFTQENNMLKGCLKSSIEIHHISLCVVQILPIMYPTVGSYFAVPLILSETTCIDSVNLFLSYLSRTSNKPKFCFIAFCLKFITAQLMTTCVEIILMVRGKHNLSPSHYLLCRMLA